MLLAKPKLSCELTEVSVVVTEIWGRISGGKRVRR